MNFDIKKIPKILSSSKVKLLVKAFFVVLAAYVLATILASLSAKFLMDTKLFGSTLKPSGSEVQVDTSKKVNYRDVRKAVLARNIFNSAGEVPDVDDLLEEGGKSAGVGEQCNKPTLNLKLVGTIFLGGNSSVASVREANYSQSDTYRVGDTIVGYDEVRVLAIERERMIVDNAGIRECYEIVKPKKVASRSGGYGSPRGGKKKKKKPRDGEEKQQGGGTVVLDSAWVEEELGPGFSKVIQSARLVPNTTGDGINGFRIFSIKSGTLFSKIGLRNGDIIQKVNDVSLEQAEQGFALYQSFREDQEIVFNITRKNKQQTVTVMIK